TVLILRARSIAEHARILICRARSHVSSVCWIVLDLLDDLIYIKRFVELVLRLKLRQLAVQCRVIRSRAVSFLFQIAYVVLLLKGQQLVFTLMRVALYSRN